MSTIIDMVHIDKNHCCDLKWGVIIMSRIIVMVYTDKKHYHDLQWEVIIVPSIIAMISTEEVKSLLWFKLTHKMV